MSYKNCNVNIFFYALYILINRSLILLGSDVFYDMSFNKYSSDQPCYFYQPVDQRTLIDIYTDIDVYHMKVCTLLLYIDLYKLCFLRIK